MSACILQAATVASVMATAKLGSPAKHFPPSCRDYRDVRRVYAYDHEPEDVEVGSLGLVR